MQAYGEPTVYERFGGAAASALPPGYRPRQPHKSTLHRVVRDHLLTFLADGVERSHDGEGYPFYVDKELPLAPFHGLSLPPPRSTLPTRGAALHLDLWRLGAPLAAPVLARTRRPPRELFQLNLVGAATIVAFVVYLMPALWGIDLGQLPAWATTSR